MSRVVHIESEEQFHNCIHDTQFATTIVDFSATWCGPCVGIAPFYDELSKNNTEMQFLSVDVDQFASLAQQANVRAMPTFVVYRDGVLTEQKLQVHSVAFFGNDHYINSAFKTVIITLVLNFNFGVVI